MLSSTDNRRQKRGKAFNYGRGGQISTLHSALWRLRIVASKSAFSTTTLAVIEGG